MVLVVLGGLGRVVVGRKRAVCVISRERVCHDGDGEVWKNEVVERRVKPVSHNGL